MTVSELIQMLNDMYRMDLHHPAIIFSRRKYFEEVCYEQWALDEIELLLKNRFPLHVSKPIDSYIWVLEEFEIKMSNYSLKNECNRFEFEVARNVTETILDMLNAMV